jgi:hypothetical protein
MENLIGLVLTVMIAVVITWAAIFPLYNTYATLATQNGTTGPSNNLTSTPLGNLTPANGVLSTTIPLMSVVVLVVFVARNILG